jgi:hypothetical protein
MEALDLVGSGMDIRGNPFELEHIFGNLVVFHRTVISKSGVSISHSDRAYRTLILRFRQAVQRELARV